MDEIKMLTREEAAEMLRVSVRTLDTLIKDGRIGAARIGRRVLVSTDALREYVERQTVAVSEGR